MTGFKNLYAMVSLFLKTRINYANSQEVDPNVGLAAQQEDALENEGEENMFAAGKQMFQEMIGSFPGIDEAMSFAQVMR